MMHIVRYCGHRKRLLLQLAGLLTAVICLHLLYGVSILTATFGITNSKWHMTLETNNSSYHLSSKDVIVLETAVPLSQGEEQGSAMENQLGFSFAENLFYEIATIFSKNGIKHMPHTRINIDYFKPKMTVREMKTLRDLLQTFHNITQEADLFYMMCSGTLLGSYRFHGLIPWDDDADVYALYSERIKLKRALQNLPPNYRLVTTGLSTSRVRGTAPSLSLRWKLYNSQAGQTILRVPWKFPFLDISFLRENATHLWDQDPSYKQSFVFPASLVYPLTQRPFMGLMLAAPFDTEAVLSQTYRLRSCASNSYDHRKERAVKYSKKRTLPCRQLRNIYPFVEHRQTPVGVNETLKYKDHSIYSILL